jgi:ketosteroid isomerase-like protein
VKCSHRETRRIILKPDTENRSRDFHKFALIVFILLALAGLLAGCARTDEEQSRQADIIAIKSFLATAGEAVNNRDVEAEVNRFTEDGIYMWPDAPAIEGHTALREWFSDRFQRVEVTLESETQEIELCGDWAFERGTYVARIEPKGDDRTEWVRGKYINILRRQPDGSWKIARRIRNRDHPAGQP